MPAPHPESQMAELPRVLEMQVLAAHVEARPRVLERQAVSAKECNRPELRSLA
jgi:hypothetical protein